jgi:hypothetical protein
LLLLDLLVLWILVKQSLYSYHGMVTCDCVLSAMPEVGSLISWTST